MRVYSPLQDRYNKSAKNNNRKLIKHLADGGYDDDDDQPPQWSLPIKRCFAFVFVTLFMQHYVAAAAAVLANDDNTSSSAVTKGLKSRMRSPKIASIHILQAVPESLPKNQRTAVSSYSSSSSSSHSSVDNQTQLPPAGKFEIRSVSGEPNYKSVNLTWEVEFVASPDDDDAVTNSSDKVEPPKSFQLFFCELQSFGPHRCRSKIVNDSSAQQTFENDDNDLEVIDKTRQVRQYMAQVDNLRMATKYSFHIRSVPKRKSMKITGRSEIFNNEVEGEDFLSNNLGGQTIVIPTKGFSAQATRCLPNASEIEVETGPNFGGKIVVDGGSCGIKGNPNDLKDKYVMRIDHKACGSMVKPETNTVETFITVQENLGIFTHSTRRFVVVCSFQSGLQTVRASFSVPGRGGVAAVQNDPFEEDERTGRGLKPIRYVDKSELVLKETTEDSVPPTTSDETEAMVEEMDNPTLNYNQSEALTTDDGDDDTTNAVAILENIIPGVNEDHIKTEAKENEERNNVGDNVADEAAEDHGNDANEVNDFEVQQLQEDGNGAVDRNDDHEQFSAKFAKFTLERNEEEINNDNDGDDDYLGATPTGRAFGSALELITINMGSVMLTVLLSVILIGIFIFVLYRETNLPQHINHATVATVATATLSSATSTLSRQHQHQRKHLKEIHTLPRTLRTKNQDLLA